MLRFQLVLFLLVTHVGFAYAQPLVRITGSVTTERKSLAKNVTVVIVGQSQSTLTDDSGSFTIYSKTRNFDIKYTLLGYESQTIRINSFPGARLDFQVILKADVNQLEQINITDKQNQLSNTATLNVADVPSMPLASGNFETMLKTLPGVSTNNELSAQYSVRGGNFDENLIYINDLEIYRPTLIRNAQQEGLSFINADLITRAKFSAGGFSAKYDDKLSSVLDVKYERPERNLFSVSASLLNSSLTFKKNFSKGFLLAGVRYKNNSNVLIKQEEKGSYSPNFGDAQLIYQHDFSNKFNVNFFGTLNIGQFKLVPTSRETQFGTSNTTLRLNVDYSGEEIDDYSMGGTAVTLTYIPKPNLMIRLINSYFSTIERERFDIYGQYLFEEIQSETSIGNSSLSDRRKGVGRYYNFGNNGLNTQVYASQVKIEQNFENHIFSTGIKFDQSAFQDELEEYNFTDSISALPVNNIRYIISQNQLSAKNTLSISNINAFIQDSYSLSTHTELQLGVRANFNSLSRQVLVSPRLLLAYRPSENNKIIRFSAGVYQQPPSYRSIRNFSGGLNLAQLAQRSYNTSIGYDYAFDGLGTRLKFTSEAYFKFADRLIPYKVDNLRIKYLADEQSKGYTYGADFSVGGEFVKDLVSYFRLSLMHADENILNDSFLQNGMKVEPGFLKRPTNQLINFSVFFQDKLLNNPTYKVHLTMLYGSKLPIGPTQAPRYLDSFYIPSYKRVDIGFSKDFLDDAGLHKPKFLENNFSSVILFLEVFNLLNINNTVSYLWLKDVNNVEYAVPNYLTGRQFNLKLIVKFKTGKE